MECELLLLNKLKLKLTGQVRYTRSQIRTRYNTAHMFLLLIFVPRADITNGSQNDFFLLDVDQVSESTTHTVEASTTQLDYIDV